jgi:hypothetical protein
LDTYRLLQKRLSHINPHDTAVFHLSGQGQA